MGETLNQFVKRVRLERALFSMSHTPKRTLTEIALDCGFSFSSDFSRNFKQRYGMSASAFDLDPFRAEKRSMLQDSVESQGGGYRLDPLPVGENPYGFEVTFRTLPTRTVAYIRVLDPYSDGERVTAAIQRLLAWADARGVADHQWLGYMWEDPTIVELTDCCYEIGVVVDDVQPEGEIGRVHFPAMRVAEIEMHGGIELEMRALDWLWGSWLPRSGYIPIDQPGFEAFIGRPIAGSMENFALRLQLPVKRG
ncbi:MAG: AraC family transcriptional regulator [Planctomycetota bacterium]